MVSGYLFNRSFRVLGGILVWALIPGLVDVYAQLTPEEIASIEQVVEVRMYPEGTHVAYTVNKPGPADQPQSGDTRELRIMEILTGDEVEVVTAPQSAFALSWIPGTNRLAFRMTDSGYHDMPQVYSVDINGEDLQMHTSAPEGVLTYAFSSDPALLAYTMRSPYPDEVIERHEQGYDMEVSGENERSVRLWLQQNDDARAVTPDDMTVWDFEWSPDMEHMAVRMTHGTGLDDDMMFSEIMNVTISDGQLNLLAESQGKVGPMAWSPDGSRFAFLAARSFNDPLPQRIYVSEVGEYFATDITPDYFEGTPEWLEWKDQNSLYFVSVEGARTTLREIPATGGVGVLLAGGNLEIFRSVSFNREHNRIVAPVHRRDHPAEVYFATLPDTGWTRLTYHNDFLEEKNLGRQETVSWFGSDGLSVEGVVVYPLNFEEGTTWPLAVLPHGGPEGVSLDGWNTNPLYPAQLLASEGYVVLKPNYRGSGGRGSDFAMANHRDLGGKEFEDVIRGIDHLVYAGVVDPGRVGISGTSYGGYFSALAATRHSDRFAAAISFAGLSNWISFMGSTDIPHEMSIVHWDLWWFENAGLNWDRSPIANLKDINTPVLVAHGLADERVHPEQSMQLHQFLKLNGVPTQLVLYPRQPHGLTERAHRIDFMGRVIDWFERYVKQAG